MLLYPCQGNYGFAEFDDLRDAQDAVKDLDGCKLLGTRIRVEHSRESKYSDRGRRRSPGRRRMTRWRLIREMRWWCLSVCGVSPRVGSGEGVP